MNTQDYFVPIKQKAEGLPSYLMEIANSNPPWREHFGFECIPVSNDWIEKEPALKSVHAHQPIKQLGLLCISEGVMYDWHVDSYRQSCINMLISQNHHSHTLFGEQRDYTNKNIVELKYEPNTYYLFNNQAKHCVVNLDGPRYLLSLYFECETMYPNVKKLLEINGVV